MLKMITKYKSYFYDYLTYKSIKKKYANSAEPPISYYDIGSAGGPPPLLRFLLRDGLVRFFGFEPGSSSWAAGKGRFDRFFRIPSYDELNVALGDEDGQATLYVTRHPGCSSLLSPNKHLVSDFEIREYFDVVHTETVDVRRLDSLLQQESLPLPEVLKMDTQGYEYNILLGLGDVIDNVVCMQLETHFKEIYLGEKVFSDFEVYMRKAGFRLIEIRRQGFFGAELVEADTFWAREPRNEREQRIFDIWYKANRLPLIANYQSARRHVRKYFLK